MISRINVYYYFVYFINHNNYDDIHVINIFVNIHTNVLRDIYAQENHCVFATRSVGNVERFSTAILFDHLLGELSLLTFFSLTIFKIQDGIKNITLNIQQFLNKKR